MERCIQKRSKSKEFVFSVCIKWPPFPGTGDRDISAVRNQISYSNSVVPRFAFGGYPRLDRCTLLSSPDQRLDAFKFSLLSFSSSVCICYLPYNLGALSFKHGRPFITTCSQLLVHVFLSWLTNRICQITHSRIKITYI